ncbi:DnaJ C-terminal domain-containing protein [Lichenibacterium ramalinae]|uniref:J domain-containing protein n=1 Tax=Lichenibacterium ramalinae TaxID=2316527 RepID=A0A4Q2RF11_9HYPH|nr:DnaJ C-terminal domain-containing protein [Lichenibacterium ramalinae]RYB04920.1 J domain-containing protein [Lichenibacterium ramalinae]
MRDPYTVLGVTKSADAAEIKKAFRKLAKKFHPDQSQEPKAKERFTEVNSAYEILGDETKRGQFDRGEIDGDGKPRFGGFGGGAGGGAGGFDFNDFGGASPFARGTRGGGGFDASDIFADLLNGGARGGRRTAQQPSRGEDVTASVAVPLEDVVKGGSARVTLPTGRTLDVKVPAGIEDGKAIRLKGQGHESPSGGPAGDAIVTVRYAPHRTFHIEGRDLRLDLPVTFYEAVLGGTVPVATLDGTVEITLPPGANKGRTLRLRGKGMPGPNGAGDLLVTPRVVLPERSDPELEALAKRLRDEQPYDPRSRA